MSASSSSSLHIAIVGAGLGGLCLAQALRRQGVAFDVFERDAAGDSRLQGYRLRIDAQGQRALAACLPPDLYALFVASASQATGPARFLTPQLAPATDRAPDSWQRDDRTVAAKAVAASAVAASAVAADLSVHRQTLREILMTGLQGHVHFGHGLDHYQPQADGRVRLHFARGAPVLSDVLVGADGVNSAVRAQYLPAAAPLDTDGVCIYGKAPLAGQDLPEALRGATSVVFGEGCTAIIEAMRFAPDLPTLAARLQPPCRLTPVEGYQYWALVASRARLGLQDLAPATWQDHLPGALQSATPHWHPALARLLQATPAHAMAALPVRHGRPDMALPTDTVTLLGDAIHAMSPAGGRGANTALQDASALAAELAGAAQGGGLRPALERYALDMRARATQAVADSAQAAVRLMAGG